MSLTAGTRLGPYEMVALLGAGGMGEVYKTRDTRLDRTAAIKILPAGHTSYLAFTPSPGTLAEVPISGGTQARRSTTRC